MLGRDDRETIVKGLRELYAGREISRREFLAALSALGVTAAGAGILAACGAAAPTATPTAAPKPTSPPPTPTAAGAASSTQADLKANPTIAAAAAAGRKALCATWGGISDTCVKQAHFDPFKAESGVEVMLTGAYNYGKIKAMVETNNHEWDIVYGISAHDRLAADGLLEPIDYKIVTDRDQLMPGFKEQYWCSGM